MSRRKYNMGRVNLATLMLGAILFLIAGCGKEEKAKESQSGSSPAKDSLVIEMKGQTGKTVFEITRLSHKMDYRNMTGGIFVRGIDSIVAGGNYGWIYSVNNVMADIASDKYVTNDTDIIKWHFRKFSK